PTLTARPWQTALERVLALLGD
ncbi:MAG: hypothetical protein K0S78_3703, partial [Thermomicrobiales bacterium]|nr:hypothetical protein [Thermomicrobiales bacterium]